MSQAPTSASTSTNAPQPIQRRGSLPLDARARHAHPELLVVDREAHPDAGHAVAGDGELGIGSELRAQLPFDELEERAVRQRRDLLVGLGEIDLDLLFLRQVAQQLEPLATGRR